MSNKIKPGVEYIGITTPFYCNDGKGNFVLHKRSNDSRDEKGAWDFGGGQLGFGEEIEKSLLREVKEEWGVKGEIQERLPAHSIIRIVNGKTVHWVAIPFFVKIDIKKAKIMEPKKHSEMGIFKLNKLPKPLHTGVKFTMKTYSKFFDNYKK